MARNVGDGTAWCFLFQEVHGIFISDPPPRHPPIVAVEGFPMPGPGAQAMSAKAPAHATSATDSLSCQPPPRPSLSSSMVVRADLSLLPSRT